MAEEMIALEEAQARILACVEPTEAVEVEAWRALGCPLARDVVADIDLAPFASSQMDGYAVRAADLAGADERHPVSLSVIAREAAGEVFAGEVGAGETVRIMTGAPMPAGADTVVKYEVVQVLAGDGNEGSTVAFRAAPEPGLDVRPAGMEASRGEVVMAAGETMTAAGAGLAASAGAATVWVHRAPRVGIISLGSELVAPGEVPAPGQIRDANSSALMASARAAGAEPVFFGIARDDEAQIAALVRQAAATCDFVVSSGGASAGDYDFVGAFVAREGEVLFDRVSLRPGKAITFGIVAGKPYLGLSGNPAAAYVGFEMLARPALRRMRGFSPAARPVQRARVLQDVPKGQQRRFYDRAVVGRDASTGELTVCEATSQNSSLLGTMHRANCLLMVPEGPRGYAAGETAPCVRVDIEEGTVL